MYLSRSIKCFNAESNTFPQAPCCLRGIDRTATRSVISLSADKGSPCAPSPDIDKDI